MRSDGIWHPRLIAVIAELGHTQTLVIADPGLPVPPGVEVIQLGWMRAHPTVNEVLAQVVRELVIDSACWAQELTDPLVLDPLGRLLSGCACQAVPHVELKRLTGSARAVVRTGDDAPFSNVILTAGVPFTSRGPSAQS